MPIPFFDRSSALTVAIFGLEPGIDFAAGTG
jgi:hypothetical protein